jgi:hypothetical protein
MLWGVMSVPEGTTKTSHTVPSAADGVNGPVSTPPAACF